MSKPTKPQAVEIGRLPAPFEPVGDLAQIARGDCLKLMPLIPSGGVMGDFSLAAKSGSA